MGHTVRHSALALILILGACSNFESWRDERSRDDAAATVFPANYKADILSLMRTYLNDPSQVRDAQISEPTLWTIDGRDRYGVCVRYNAKKSNGQYAGVKDNLFTFRQGRLDRILDPTRDQRDTLQIREHCKDAAMKPFVELERLSR
jgi:hypothetical protein